jgi:hypothetical protein
VKKLNQTELKVLTERLHGDLKTAAIVAQVELDARTLSARQKRAKAISVHMKAANAAAVRVSKELGKATGGYIEPRKEYFTKQEMSVKHITIKLCEKQDVINLPSHNSYYVTDSEIYKSLVIAQISCPDVGSLVEMVAQQFSNEL